MSEQTARQALKSTLQGSATFATSDVTLNDHSILDQSGALSKAPFVIIYAAEEFSWRYDSMSGAEDVWDIEALLVEAWDKDWPTTLEAFIASRQAIRDAFTAGARAPGTGKYYNVDEIRSAGPIVEMDRGDLTYMVQLIIFSVEEFE